MFRKELTIENSLVNNFYAGSIYDLVFIDLEFWPDFTYVKPLQRIYGYTITRILKHSKNQYIKIQFLENKSEERKLINDIFRDMRLLQNKVFIGYNIISSDIYCLNKRARAMTIKPNIDITLFDFFKHPQKNLYRGGLNGLCEYLEIQVNKQINGFYIYKNARKVIEKKANYQEILSTIYEYCLEDAKNYFYIVSKWENKFAVINKDNCLKLALSK